MDNDKVAYNGLIEEYKTLRQEIAFHSSFDKHIRKFIFLLAIGVFGSKNYLNLDSPVFALTSALTLVLWHDSIQSRKAFRRIGTYIAVFIEPRVPGLSWEGYVDNSKRNMWEYLVRRLDLLLAYSSHAIIGILIVFETSIVRGCLLAITATLAAFIMLLKEYDLKNNYRHKQLEFWRQKKAILESDSNL